jgi:ribosomal protein S18 acetylase RimI-like enzyme
LLKFFRLYGEVSIKNQRGFGIGNPLVGVAFWKFANQDDLSISIKSLGKFLPLLFTFYLIGYLRARAIINQQETLHRKYASEPHFYLDNIGVLPSYQGQGMASRLIRPFLEIADEQKVSAYTDTVTQSNVALYEHLGFQCVEERLVARTAITVWALHRAVQL